MLMVNIDYRILIKSFLIFFVISISISCYNISFAEVKAFPEAEGWGTGTTHGRGGRVIHVTNLNATGSGSFKEACEASGSRIVVFDVSGVIDLGNNRIFVTNPYLYIAGQTAPGDGICLMNGPLVIHTHDVLVRYIRSRPGDEPGGYEVVNRDGITIDGDYSGDGSSYYNIVIDHCSVSWGIDENMSTWFPQHDITISWNIISEGLENAGHPIGPHSKGLLIGDNQYNVSVHHNYFAHNNARNPYVKKGTHYDVVNNVVYNWGEFPAHVTGDTTFSANLVKNYFKKGVNSSGNTVTDWSSPYEIWNNGLDIDNSLYLEGNIGFNNPDGSLDNWVMTKVPISNKSNTRFSAPAITESSAVDVVALVLEGAGATFPKRDSVDARVVSDFTKGSGRIIDSQKDVGGWPIYNSTTPPKDTDGDGMPDSWETSYGLNINDESDGAQDRDGDGYTNIEEYINSLVSSPLPESKISSPREFQKL